MLQVKLGDLVGDSLEESFHDFDLTEIQQILSNLKDVEAIDLAHAEFLQQKALYGADVIIEFIGKMTKMVGYLETKISSVRNKVSLEYQAPDGGRTTSDMKIWAGNASKEVEEYSIILSKAKASKIVLEKKYDILIRLHHHYKDIAAGLRKGILGYNTSKPVEGYE